jgi:hypothetical protein
LTLNHQTVGNVGLYYVCYRLSLRGWNVMPTSRNARGVDVIAYSQDAEHKVAIQVKALSKRNAVGLGKCASLIADWLVVCRYVQREKPECFILNPSETEKLSHPSGKAPKVSYWIEARDYEAHCFLDRWERIEG